MPKIRKVKRRKTFKANVNRKRLRDKLRKLPDIGCKDIKAAWEPTKSTRTNLVSMGLAYDPNEALKIPNSKRQMMEEAKHGVVRDSGESEDEKDVKHVPSKTHVALNLEAEAKAPRERLFRLPNQQVQFVTYLMDKYGDDYKAMTRDKKNYYQMTWRQIRAKINTFKGIPEQYAEYLVKKGDIVLDDPTSLEESRKKTAEENVKIFCAPKPKKIKKPVKSQWLVESDDQMDFDTADKLENIGVEDTEKSADLKDEPLKKLQLFPDDDDDDNQKKGKVKSKQKKTKVTSESGNGKMPKKSEVTGGQTNKTKGGNSESSKKVKTVETLPSSDSDSDEEMEGDNVEEGFVDLDELSDEQLSDDDILDDGKFVTDSDDSD